MGYTKGFKRSSRGTGREGGYAAKRARPIARRPARGMAGGVPYRRNRNAATQGFVGIEHKFYDTFLIDEVIAATTGATAGVVDPSSSIVISAPAQANGPSDRDGKKILIESVLITGNVLFPKLVNQASTAIGNPTVYIALIEDHQTNAASMTSELALKNPSNDISLCANPLKNLLRSTRFTTHKVWTINPQMMPVTADQADKFDTQGQRIPFELYKKLNMKVNFNGAGIDANIANVSDNSLHMIAFTNFAAYAQINYNARIRFVG